MQQLTGLDASFLYLETTNCPMHIGGLSIYDPSTAEGGAVGFKQVLANVLERAHRVAAMNNVLVEVPLGLDHPYWKSDGAFDPEFHIRHIALPKPGDWRQLCIQASRLHARPLDRARPLWEFYVIEGLDNVEGFPPGCFALLTKMHHAAIDGASGLEIASAIHDLSPDSAVQKKHKKIKKERHPSNSELIWRSQINSIKKPLRVFEVAKNTFPSVAKMAAGLALGKLSRVTDVPRTRFNTNVSPHRVFDAVEFDLSTIKQIKDAVPGVTVNDVALAICGGGLRKYLQHKDELPESSLAAMAPVNIRTKGQQGQAGNQVSQLTVRVGSDIDDPLKRLEAVSAGTSKAKELNHAIGAKTMTDYTQFMPSTLTAAAARLSSRLALVNRVKPSYNCVITNVPGPQVPLYFTGAKMLSNFGLGPAIDGMGLFHALLSYCGKFNISVNACREMMPDPAFYTDCLQASFDELVAATTPKATKTSNKKKAASKKKAVSKKKVAKKKTTKKPTKKTENTSKKDS